MNRSFLLLSLGDQLVMVGEWIQQNAVTDLGLLGVVLSTQMG